MLSYVLTSLGLSPAEADWNEYLLGGWEPPSGNKFGGLSVEKS